MIVAFGDFHGISIPSWSMWSYHPNTTECCVGRGVHYQLSGASQSPASALLFFNQIASAGSLLALWTNGEATKTFLWQHFLDKFPGIALSALWLTRSIVLVSEEFHFTAYISCVCMCNNSLFCFRLSILILVYHIFLVFSSVFSFVCSTCPLWSPK